MSRCQCLALQDFRDLALELLAPLLSDTNLEVGQFVGNPKDINFGSCLDFMLAIQDSKQLMCATCHLFGDFNGVIGLDAKEVIVVGEAR